MKNMKKVVSLVLGAAMCGSVVAGVAGCGSSKGKGPAELSLKDGKLYYTAGTEIVMDVGDKKTRSISFGDSANLISGTVTLPDGKTYDSTSLKPAWKAFGEQINVNFKSRYSEESGKVATAINSTTDGGMLKDRDVITDGGASIITNSEKFVNLAKYLDYMPNYKAFLNANPVVYLSLLAETNGENKGAMYYAPYFDGNDDIEKYVLTKQNWVASLLDATAGDANQTWQATATAKSTDGNAHVQSFMGTTGSWSVDGLDKDSHPITITVNYDKVKTAANTAGSALNTAIKAAYAGFTATESGNIIDIQNAIITANKTVTGAQLLKVMQEYIKVAYYQGNDALYTKTGYKLSDVFNGVSAAWDADLMAALGRCLLTNPALLKSGSAGNSVGGANATPIKDVYLVSARQPNMQRMADVASFVGELYGVRGMESRNLYSYIGTDGKLKDARQDAASYDAMAKFNALYAEGMVGTGASGNGETSFYKSGTIEALMIHDYVNTQTPAGFQIDGKVAAGTYAIEEGYYYAPIITPVSKWNDGQEKYMRFIESWRSVKDSGFAIPLEAVQGKPEKFSAVLNMIDKMFTTDGMITLTYGPKADNAQGANGFWYNPEATAAQVAAGTYFTYNGVKYYSEVKYAGSYAPTPTQNIMKAYYGEEVNGTKFDGKMDGENKWNTSCVRSYTDFARYVIGASLALGNKLQSLEFQMTSSQGLAGAKVVSDALTAGIIKHVQLGIAENKWYTSVPTTLPYSAAEKATLATAVNVSDFGKDYYFTNNNKATTNLYWEIIFKGYNAANYASAFSGLGLSTTTATSAAEIMTKLNEKDKLNDYVAAKNTAWSRLQAYYNAYLKK